jgi:hypothetical protein
MPLSLAIAALVVQIQTLGQIEVIFSMLFRSFRFGTDYRSQQEQTA